MSERWLAVILAAGAGRRLGGVPKCLLQLDGQSVLERLLHAVGQAVPQVRSRIVLGHHAQVIDAALRRLPAACQPERVINPQPGDEPVDSLHLGLEAMPPDRTAVMVLLADLPLLSAADLQAASAAFDGRAGEQALVWPEVQGTPGHPVMFTTRVAQALRARPGLSLRQWRREHPDQVRVWCTDRSGLITDIDDAASLQQLRQATGQDWRLP